jgi:hypothetical protein
MVIEPRGRESRGEARKLSDAAVERAARRGGGEHEGSLVGPRVREARSGEVSQKIGRRLRHRVVDALGQTAC